MSPPDVAALRVFVGLGSNLGDALATLQQAVAELNALPEVRVRAISPLYRSAPVQAQGPDFLNAVVEVQTRLAPLALLQSLQDIERHHGRLRPYRNAPRTLDLDLLLHGQSVLDLPGLCLPHPRMHERAFVLQPLLDLAPDAVHPVRGLLAPLSAGIHDQSLERVADSWVDLPTPGVAAGGPGARFSAMAGGRAA